MYNKKCEELEVAQQELDRQTQALQESHKVSVFLNSVSFISSFEAFMHKLITDSLYVWSVDGYQHTISHKHYMPQVHNAYSRCTARHTHT